MIKALWLTSWYPNRLDAMNGDFIQRHARAVAAFAQVYVIHAEPDNQNIMLQHSGEIRKEGNLTEQIFYYLPAQSESLSARIFSGIRYKKIMREAVEKYIQEHGRPDIVHVHVPMKAGIIALWLKKKYGIPFVVTEHWTIYNEAAKDGYAQRDFIFKSFTKKIFREAALFLPVSKQLGEAICKQVCPVTFQPIPNVADRHFFHYEKKEKDATAPFTFIHVSTLKPQKNPAGILRAFTKFVQEIPAAKLMMVGENPDPFIDMAVALGLTPAQIVFTGLISYQEVAEKMKSADAFVLFSRYENLPCVIIEALCCGLPVVSSQVGGISELVNASNGLLLDADREDQLYDKMVMLYKNFSNYNQQKIAADAAATYSYPVIGKAIHTAYVQVLARQKN